MDSRTLRAVLVGTPAVGLATWFGTGLAPSWPITWLLPVCGFVAASRMTGWRAYVPGTIGLFLGQLNLWTYLSILPLPVRLLVLLIPAGVFGFCTSRFSHWWHRDQTARALLGPAAIWVAYEYLYSVASPHGTFGALAYCQSDFLPVVQLAALGGIWVVDGLLFFVGAGVTVIILDASQRRVRRPAVLAVAGVAAGAGVYGLTRLHSKPTTPSIAVALIASDRPENMHYGETAASGAILHRYLAHVPRLAEAGAQLILMPEHLFAWRDAPPDENGPEFDRLLAGAARSNRVWIGLAVDRRDAKGVWWNEERLYAPDGHPSTYEKHHLLPGYERMAPGTEFTTVALPGGVGGLAICKDLDFPALGRAYGDRRVAALIVPAFDFGVDGWLHSRMAVFRGVESGFAVVRAAKTGRLTVSDCCGRVLAEQRSDAAKFAVLAARCPLTATPTLYARWGDWFAWLACGVVAVALAPWPWWTQRRIHETCAIRKSGGDVV